MKRGLEGFTFLELALILVVIGILMGFGVGLLGSLIKNSKFRKTESILEQSREALVGYVMSNGHLPCPDADGDGQEDSSSGSCTCSWPNCFLPEVTVGIRSLDAYGHKLYYDVDDTFTSFTSLRGFCVHTPYITPAIQVTDGSSSYSIVAIVISPGLKDADDDGNKLDGENEDGSPFVQEGVSVSNIYDDITKEISVDWLLARICDTNLRRIKIQISNGYLCYHGKTYSSSDNNIFLSLGDTVHEYSCNCEMGDCGGG